MKIEHLLYIKEISKHQSISAAAKQLYIGQTTLSAIVRSLEDELGVRILQRTPGGVTATPDGEKLLAYAEKILAQYEEMQQAFRPNESLEKMVHVLGNETGNSALSVHLAQKIQETYRQASLIFVDIHRTKTISCIREGLGNIGVTSYDVTEVESALALAEKSDIKMELVYNDKFYLCVSTQSAFADRISVDISELANQSIVVPAYYSAIYNGTYLTQVLHRCHRVATLTNNELVKRAVVGSDMVTVLAGSNFINDPYLLRGQIALVQLTGFEQPNETGLYLLYRDAKYLDNCEKMVLDEIRNFYRAVF